VVVFCVFQRDVISQINTNSVKLSSRSQAKVLNGGGDLPKSKSTSPCLLAIPEFDRIAGLYNIHLNFNRGIC